jgi:hypothetical protein
MRPASHLIKSHHNVGGLPENMQLKLLEPLRELFKDEVRQLGLELGLPANMIHRHPCVVIGTFQPSAMHCPSITTTAPTGTSPCSSARCYTRFFYIFRLICIRLLIS